MTAAHSTQLGDLIEDISAGVSLRGENRPPASGEVGILTLSALSGVHLDPTACKAVSGDLVPKLGPHVQAGTILMSRSNTPDLVGACVYAETEIPDRYLPDLIWEIKIRPDAPCDSRWLAEYLRSSQGRRKLLRAAAGTSGTMIKLSMDRLRRLKFLVPPVDIQRAIVSSGSHLDRMTANLSSLADAKRTFKRGLMQQLLTGQKRFPQFRDSKWRIAALGDLVNYTPRKVPKPPGQFLSAGVRSHGKGVFLKKDFLSEGIALDELFELKHQDLVVNITFGWEGAVAIVPPEADGALVSHRFPTYKVDENQVLVEYLRHVIRSKRFVFDVGVASPGGAGRNRVLNRQEFLEIIVNIPGIEEQDRIAQVLNDCDREIDLLAALQEQIENQKGALLSRLLSGELKVPAPA